MPRTTHALLLSLVLPGCAPALQAPPAGPLAFPDDHGVHRDAQTE